jgi:hypothetical protein
MPSTGNIAIGGAAVWSVSADRHHEIMALLPERIRRFMYYEAASSFSEEAVLAYFRSYGEDATLRKLQHDQRMETINIYGMDHPEALKPTKV